MSFSKSSVASFIFSDDNSKILLVKRRDVPVWVVPGGGIDPLESEEDAAIREGEEETGYQLKSVCKIGEYLPKNKLTNHTFAFKLKITGGEAKLNDEIQDIAFFDVNALPYHLPPPYADWINDALVEKDPFVKVTQSVNYASFIKFLLKHPILVCRFLLSRCGLAINSRNFSKHHKPASK